MVSHVAIGQDKPTIDSSIYTTQFPSVGDGCCSVPRVSQAGGRHLGTRTEDGKPQKAVKGRGALACFLDIVANHQLNVVAIVLILVIW